MPKQNTSYKCLSLIMLKYVIRANEKYCPQGLLEEYKYKIKNDKKYTHIDYDFYTSSSDESDSELFY